MFKGLTVSLVFDASSLNYGESEGNTSILKKITIGDKEYPYMSREAVRYEIYNSLSRNFSIDKDSPHAFSEDKAIQFATSSNISNYVEFNLFGYMKTIKDKSGKYKTRSAVVRLSPAIALTPFRGDMNFGTNKNFADRTGKDMNPFQYEIHSGYYVYTMSVQLDRVGVDDNDNIKLSKQENFDAVSKLLDVIKFLNRDIKGRPENLNPVFLIGGVYDICNPFFLNRIKLKDNKIIDADLLQSVTEATFNDKKIAHDTSVGVLSHFWDNEEQLKSIVGEFMSPSTAIDRIKSQVASYYQI